MKSFGMRWSLCVPVAFAIAGATLAQAPSPNEKKTISITWFGHAVFDIVSPVGTHSVNRSIPYQKSGDASGKQRFGSVPSKSILVTHSHGDHLGDAVDLAN
jgi:L-ascorbate metabolism protein UlaG (beta-lactamase superfamily)